MAENPKPKISLAERSSRAGGSDEKLSKWVVFSLVLHGGLIASLFIIPFLPTRSAPQYPVYTVDLVGGDKIGGTNLGTELAPEAPPKQTPRKSAAEPPPPVAKSKPEAKKEKAEKPKPVEKAEKPKPVEKAVPAEEKLIAKENIRKEPEKKAPVKEAKEDSESGQDALEQVRERLMQSAIERVKSRVESKTSSGKGEVISSGPGEGEGAAALGPGGRGGGVVKGIEFIAYQNRMFETIKANWAWVGQKSDLKVVVHFGIKDNGEIVGLKIVQASGDPSYDESVLRALRKSNPLPSPPESYRKDFANVELTFRPKDLGA